jgi:hypothetical protein
VEFNQKVVLLEGITAAPLQMPFLKKNSAIMKNEKSCYLAYFL